MQGPRRVRLIALPFVLGAALLCASAASGHRVDDFGLTVTITGPGTVTGPGINCRQSSGDCVEILTAGTSVTLTEAPDPGATFTGWGGFGGCSGTGTTCTITMDDNKALAADFTAGGGGGGGTQGLSLTVTGAGTVTGSGISCGNGATDCSELYATGSAVTLTATPASGSTFTGWGGACSGSAATCTVTMSAAQSVSATFATGGTGQATLTVNVTGSGQVIGPGINCGNGGTDCTENYPTGSAVTLVEVAGSGTTFTGWGGSCTGSQVTCTVSMTAAKTVSATFGGSGSQATLTVTVSGSGRVTGPGISCGLGNTDCSEVYAASTTVTLTETPASGASFAGWGTACTGASTTCTILMNASKSLTASFTQGSTQKILTVTLAGSGRVSGPAISCGTSVHDCSNAYNDGTIVTLIATPASGAVFLGWGGACSGTATTCTVLMNAPRAVSASFSRPGANTGVFTVRSLGNPVVVRTSVGWSVSLRFFTNRSASALLRLSLSGRLVSAFTFSPRAGNVLVGPFNVARQGTYRFRLTLTDANGNVAELAWNSCLSVSGCGTFRPAGAFVVGRAVTATRTSTGWVVHVHFQASAAGVATIRMTRAGRLVSSGRFAFHRGAVVVNLPARQAGLHVITLTARSSTGRQVRISWNALLS